jgi:deoxyribose-phosphate aldolase
MNLKSVHQYIEHTNLSPTLTDRAIESLISEAREYNFSGICVPPFWVKKVYRDIKNDNLNLTTVIGFPLGYNMTEIKIEEMKRAIGDGANELDVVMNISAFKSDKPWVKIEIAKCAHLAHQNNTLLKIIIETAYLEDEEIIRACKICQDAGADFVKTSTGYAPTGARLEHVQLMRKHLSSEVGIKASGGIKALEQVNQLIEAGADRIGTSSGVQIMKEYSPLSLK